MSSWTLFLLAAGLSADAFAVSIGKGLQLREGILRTAFTLGAAFGLAQAIMPVIGWALGSAFASRVSAVAPWVAFALLSAIGAKMLWEAFQSDDESPGGDAAGSKAPKHLPGAEVFMLAIATSIDALAVGVSLAVLEVSIWFTVTAIGIVTFSLSFVAVFLGHKAGTRYQRPAEIVGALILIGIGVRVVVEGVFLKS